MNREVLSPEEQTTLWRKLGLDVDSSSTKERGDSLVQPAASPVASRAHSARGSEADMASIVVSALERKVQALQQELERVRSGLHQQMHQEIEKTKAALRSELDEKIERVRAELRQAADTSAQVSPVISTPEKQNGSDELEEPQEDCSVLKFLESLGAPFVDAFRGSKNK